jgi:amidase
LWNVDQGLALTSEEVARSDAERHALYRRVIAFFEDHDFLALPSALVLPFDLETEWVREIEGVQMET